MQLLYLNLYILLITKTRDLFISLLLFHGTVIFLKKKFNRNIITEATFSRVWRTSTN